jgi:hypothetical protein
VYPKTVFASRKPRCLGNRGMKITARSEPSQGRRQPGIAPEGRWKLETTVGANGLCGLIPVGLDRRWVWPSHARSWGGHDQRFSWRRASNVAISLSGSRTWCSFPHHIQSGMNLLINNNSKHIQDLVGRRSRRRSQSSSK